MATINENEARLSNHAEVCAIRYETINARLKRLEQILMGSCCFSIVVLRGISLKL